MQAREALREAFAPASASFAIAFPPAALNGGMQFRGPAWEICANPTSGSDDADLQPAGNGLLPIRGAELAADRVKMMLHRT